MGLFSTNKRSFSLGKVAERKKSGTKACPGQIKP